MDKIEELFEHMRGLYFKRDGTPYKNVMEWCADFEKGPELRRIDETILWWGGRVSTVWLGLNHQYGAGPPLIFESMLFPPKSLRDLDSDRYSTEAQAVEGHKAMCQRWRFPLFKIAWVWVGVILETAEYILYLLRKGKL